MSTEFLAGFVSGVAGLVIGSPLDVLKTRQQRGNSSLDVGQGIQVLHQSWFAGIMAPILSLGLMNAILFWSYYLVMQVLGNEGGAGEKLVNCFLAGACSGLCVCFVSVPTELVKVTAQLSNLDSLQVIRHISRNHGLKGFYRGFAVTISRDSLGYAFYFLAYEAFRTLLPLYVSAPWVVLLSGGLAGCISWFSIFPLDTIKTRLQAELPTTATQPLIPSPPGTGPPVVTRFSDTIEFAKTIYHEEGWTGFFSGLPAAMIRAFCVNAVIFWTDGWIQSCLGPETGS